MATRVIASTRASTTDFGGPKRLPPAFPRWWVAVLVLSDLAMFLTASYLGSRLGFHHWNVHRTAQRHIWAQTASIVMWLLVFQRLGLYKRTFALSTKDELYYTVAALAIGTMPQMLIFTIYPGISTSRIALALSLAASIVLVCASRSVLHLVRVGSRIGMRRRIAVVGSIERVSSAVEAMELNDSHEKLLIAVDDIDQTIREVDLTRDRDLESIEWFRRARIWGCNMLVLTEMVPPSIMPHLLEATARNQIRFAFAPPRIRCHSFELTLQTDGRQALIVPSQLRACTPRAQLFKRVFDLTIGLFSLVVLLPIIALAALAVYVESGAPVFFRQERVGKGGRIFNIIKLRSMRVNAEAESGAVWAAERDPRRTKVGAILRRFSIDEMPQIFNVLRGEMSLVGPRPERPVFVDLFRKELARYDERHLVSPGITGWSQVHMKRVLNPSDAAEKLFYDLQYVECWSPFLDISVLFQTAFEFLFHGAA